MGFHDCRGDSMATSSKVPRDDTLSPEMRRFLDDLSRYVRKSNFTATAAPTVTDDSDAGWIVGSRWINLTADNEYVLTDATVGAAVWKLTT